MKGLAICLLALVTAATGAEAQMRTEPVRFAAGADRARVTGTLVGDDFVAYTLDAEAGQTMTVALEASNGATYFNVYAPGTGARRRGAGQQRRHHAGDQPLRGHAGGQTGRYTISVYMMRAAARRDERSDYTLDIAVSGARPAVVEGDFADGMAGGPDWWQVTTSGGPLNLRSAPSGERRRRSARPRTARRFATPAAAGRRRGGAGARWRRRTGL